MKNLMTHLKELGFDFLRDRRHWRVVGHVSQSEGQHGGHSALSKTRSSLEIVMHADN